MTYLFKINSTILGYVTIAMGSVRKEHLRELRESQRFRHIPCLLLGQMARDITYKGKGVGKIMVSWVFSKASELSREVGCRYVLVEAEPDKEIAYQNFGFQPLPPRRGSNTVLMYFDLGPRS